jgi:hypothetical protein
VCGVVDHFVAEETADAWSGVFDDFVARFAGRFGRVEPRRRMVSYLRGPLSETERKNGWTLAEAAGDTGPQGMQRLLNHYLWDTTPCVTMSATRSWSTSEIPNGEF